MSTRSEVRHDPFAEPETPPARRRWVGVGLVVVLLLVAAGVVALRMRPDPPPGPEHCGTAATGLDRIAGECLGVTDGSYLLDPHLAAVQQQILGQNRAVGQRRAVTVALLGPLTPDADSAMDIEEVRHQVQGAAVAQKWINDDAAATNSVRIRLVLANEGSHQIHWPPVVERLHRMTTDPAPLVAAVGMGVSVQETLDAARQLSRYDIPSIGAITTADDLNQDAAPGFFRVSPANRDFVRALEPWTARFSSALLVYDVASDDVRDPDIFTRSLRDDFLASFRRSLAPTAVNFHGSENSKDVQPNRFGRIRDKVCTERTPLVLFAGRRNDLRQFLAALQRRSCPDPAPVTVMVAGTDLGGLLDGDALRRARITLIWSAGADVTAWRDGRHAPPHFDRFLQAYRELYGRQDPDLADLADGQAIEGYDALLAAATAAQSVDDDPADGSATGRDRPLPSGVDVRGALLNTRSLGAVPGAGGDLAYEQRDEGRSGDPLGKQIPVLQLGRTAPRPPGDVYVTQ
jgi:ABC-type branched-subunit amino acid transport system substrate-binding protein